MNSIRRIGKGHVNVKVTGNDNGRKIGKMDRKAVKEMYRVRCMRAAIDDGEEKPELVLLYFADNELELSMIGSEVHRISTL